MSKLLQHLTLLLWSANLNCQGNPNIPEIPFKVTCGTKHQYIPPGGTFHVTTLYYNDLSNCEWVYSTSPDRHLQVEFSKLHLGAGNVSVYSSDDSNDWALVKTVSEKDDTLTVNASTYMKISFSSNSTEDGFETGVTSLCGGTVTDKMFALSPTWFDWYKSDRQFTCEWTVKVRPGRKIEVNIGSLNGDNSCSTYVILRNGDPEESSLGSGKYCGNKHEIRGLESTGNVLHITFVSNNEEQFKTFDVWYKEKTVDCGDTYFLSDEHNWKVISSPNFPSASIPFVECVWLFSGLPGDTLRIDSIDRFHKDNRSSICSTEFVEFRDGSSELSPLLGSFCNDKPGTIKTKTNTLYVKYSTQVLEPKIGFKANVSIDVCGGVINAAEGSTNEGFFSSPNYPKRYWRNLECAWEIQADLGSKVSVEFIERFEIEGLPGVCVEDAVIIYDWKDGAYVEIARLCGQERPESYNSTHNRMKVVFRTNDRINRKGFKAHWSLICGGHYIATEEVQHLYSPGYPNNYPPNKQCIYKLTSPMNMVYIKFDDFEIEDSSECQKDNVTIHKLATYGYYKTAYCGTRPPDAFHYDDIQIDFNSDSSITKRGFSLSYWMTYCDHLIDEPTVLSSSTINSTGLYDYNLNCKWRIRAPENKIIVIRFLFLDLENIYRCFGDYLAIYDGLIVEKDKRLALACAKRDNNSNLVIRSTNNTMLLHFKTDFEVNEKGFKVSISFTNTESTGCGGSIDLTSTSILKSPLNGSERVYESNLDCIWRITAPVGNIIKVKFTSFNIAPCQTETELNACECDYVEIRDGVLAHSMIIGKYCGSVPPLEVSSSGNTLSVTLRTDGDINSSGFEATLSTEKSVCGQSHWKPTVGNKFIRSPNYDLKPVPRGLHCSYSMNSDFPYDHIMAHVYISNLDLHSVIKDNRCEGDKLIISKYENLANQTLGSDYEADTNTSLVIDTSRLFEHAKEMTPPTIVLCGIKSNLDFYLPGYVNIRLITSPRINSTENNHKGFDMVVTRGFYCPRNFTQAYGRIKTLSSITNLDWRKGDCYTLITVPENQTVSAYFMFKAPVIRNENLYLQIYDGNTTSAETLRKIDVNDTSLPAVFSTGRHMLIHSHRERYGMIGYDLTYVSSEKHLGCGGRLVNNIGRVASPMYPEAFRVNTTCEWELETLTETRLHLRFETFDLRACEQVFLYLVDSKGDVISRHCEESPADYTSPDNYVKIVFVSAGDNAGRGWVADFIGIA